jgi:hypothetical protein
MGILRLLSHLGHRRKLATEAPRRIALYRWTAGRTILFNSGSGQLQLKTVRYE